MNASDHTYEAIVIGGGLSGSWAAKELCDNGVQTLLLERGRNAEHIIDYPTTNTQPWQFDHRGQLTQEQKNKNPIASRCYAYREPTTHFFIDDDEHPYIQESPFDWLRGYQVGGKSLMWARQTQRWSEYDFEGPARDGFAVDWPIRYADLDPWYGHVERFAGISGEKDGLDILPDGDFLKAFGLTCVDEYFRKIVSDNYKNRHVIYARCAHITEQKEIFTQQGRGTCQSRTICERGCPFGAYFSANSSTIPWALKSGNLTMRPHSVVHSIIYDHDKKRATGVRVIDANSNEATEYFAKTIFLNASTINSNLILLNSTSDRFPNGLGNDSGTLGQYLAFHNYRARVNGIYNGMLDKTDDGRSPTSAYIPRFRNVKQQETEFLRGYAAGFGSARVYNREVDYSANGQVLMDQLLSPRKAGPWRVGSHMMGETIPKVSNYVKLDTSQKDKWGIPLARIKVDYDDNDEKMTQDYIEQMTEMFEKAGFEEITVSDNKNRAPGNDIHEMGGVRMGRDPKTSMLNKWNQLHLVPNVYVTDGACMTSTSTQNPSLTFMAMAARSANHAIEAMKKGIL